MELCPNWQNTWVQETKGSSLIRNQNPVKAVLRLGKHTIRSKSSHSYVEYKKESKKQTSKLIDNSTLVRGLGQGRMENRKTLRGMRCLLGDDGNGIK